MVEKIRRWASVFLLLYIAVEVTYTQIEFDEMAIKVLFMSIKIDKMWESSP